MSAATDTTLRAAEWRKRRGFIDFLIRLRGKPLGLFGFIIVVVLLVAGIFSEWLAPYAMNEIHMTDRMLPPGSYGSVTGYHLLGTDNLGRDLLSQIIYGARVSMIVGLSAATLSMVVSAAIGLTSGYLGGKFDILVQRVMDAYAAFPQIVLLLTFMSVLGAGYLQLILVLGVFGGIGGARGPRALAFWVKESAYFDAARAVGCSTQRVILRHMVPNVMPMLIVGFSLGIGGIILSEASLSFLGFGLPPHVPSWGGMIAGSNRVWMEAAPWLIIWPGLALTLTVYSVNMFGDALRDLLDPRLRGGVERYDG